MIEVDFTVFIQIINFLVAYFLLDKMVLYPFSKKLEIEAMEKENYIVALESCFVGMDERKSYKQADFDKHKSLFFKSRPEVLCHCVKEVQMVSFATLESDLKKLEMKDVDDLKEKLCHLIVKV